MTSDGFEISLFLSANAIICYLIQWNYSIKKSLNEKTAPSGGKVFKER